MKLILIAMFFISTLAFAQEDELTYTPPTKEQNDNIIGTLTPPTKKQKKHIKIPAKKTKKLKKLKSKKHAQKNKSKKNQ